MSSFYVNPREIEFTNELFGKKKRFNPRTIENKGFTSEEMTRLREGIQQDGLDHPIKIHRSNKSINLIQGERRLRCILNLIERDEEAIKNDLPRVLVYNQRTKKRETAIDVYLKGGVECKESDESDEKERLRQSILENTLHKELTDYELLIQCEQMELAKFTRGEQAKVLGVSEAWISQSHGLLNGPECIIEAMRNGFLVRTAALTFLEVEDDLVEPLLKRVVNQTFAVAAEKEQLAKKELENAKEELQKSKNSKTLADYMGNKVSSTRASRQVSRNAKVVEKAENKLKTIQDNKDKSHVTVASILKEADNMGVSKLSRPRSIKITREHETEIGELLKDAGKSIKKDGTTFSTRDVKLVHEVIKWQLSQNQATHPLDVIDLVG